MDQQLKQTWIEALESGKYKKGKHLLRQVRKTDDNKPEESFCCLGVLCEIMKFPKKELTVSLSKNETKTNYIFSDRELDSSCANLNGNIIDPYKAKKLAIINDHSDTFDEVIEYIKTNL